MIPLVKVSMPNKSLLMPELEKILYSGQIAEGEKVYEFENKFRKFFMPDNVNGLAMSSGTAALHAALHFSGVSAGDEVITTSMTAEPTNMSICQVGGKPVFCDVDPETGNISPESIISSITPKTKAIIIVHYAGYPVELSKIRKIADDYNIKLIEDCAHALGAKFDKKGVGSIGDFSIFSFQAIKHMNSIDGGFIFYRNVELTEDLKRFRWFGLLKGAERTKIDVTSVGYKYNMNNVNATIGIFALDDANENINAHVNNAKFYNRSFDKISGVNPAKIIGSSEPSYWLYTLLCDDSEDLIEKLNSNGVMASKLHRPNHLHSYFNSRHLNLSGLNEFYKSLVHIPVGWWVSEDERNRIVKLIQEG
ncbi:DegT/DnrJ/EryC1/StrS family aminotransferase [Vibrio cyclitrophicus]|uniref:DegT/DnrJ/EryC1/StrS family aminotransferase n=1 Tax=Vibrio cyclitrophicus TaxID=47951 RepID=UPI000C817272|nr:DegT/DnrJ/EryC1/StrS family aminotransferase [Vibrio cyclitrophicus]PMH74642.1 pyridoxal-5'-phosphate-dependent protein [Vibrio cyclitrophicus]